MSVFDPKIFQSMTFTGANSTESVPIPEGEWPFEFKKVELATWANKDKTNEGLKLVLNAETEAEEVAKVTGRPKNSLRVEIMLDLTEDKTGLDFGKGMNVQLGRAREACGINKAGEPFTWDMFVGRQAKIAVSHRLLEDGRAVAQAKAILPISGSTPGQAPSGYVPGA